MNASDRSGDTVTLRMLDAGDSERFSQFRLAGLRESGSAFAMTYEDEKGLRPEAMARRFDEGAGNGILAAFSAGEIVGVVGVSRRVKGKTSHKATLWGLYVDVAFRRRGVATMLVHEILARLRATKAVSRVNVSVIDPNDRALRLYTKLGFVEYGREPEAICADGKFQDETLLSLAVNRPEAKPAR